MGSRQQIGRHLGLLGGCREAPAPLDQQDQYHRREGQRLSIRYDGSRTR